jgi:hypothetical protein
MNVRNSEEIIVFRPNVNDPDEELVVWPFDIKWAVGNGENCHTELVHVEVIDRSCLRFLPRPLTGRHIPSTPGGQGLA